MVALPPREEQIARNIERVRRMPAGPIGEAKRSPSGWGHWPHLGTDRSDTRSPARPVAAAREQIARNIERVRRMPARPIGEAKRSPSRWGQWPHLGTDRSDTRSPTRPVAAAREQIARNIERVRRMPAGPIGEAKRSPSGWGHWPHPVEIRAALPNGSD